MEGVLEEFGGVGRPTPTRASNARRRSKNLFKALHPVHERVCTITHGVKLPNEAFSALFVEAFKTGLEQPDDLVDRVFKGVDGALECEELMLDLLERESLLHQSFDGVDPAQRLDWIKAARAEVLPFLPNPA